MSVEIKVEPFQSNPSYAEFTVGGVRVGVAQCLPDGTCIPDGCRKPRTVKAAAISMLTKRYDSSMARTDKLGEILRELLNEPGA